MQTFKTAVIVVLMLTVVYGAYVSLTTPPAQVPEEIVRIMETDPEFSADGADALAALGISEGAPSDMMGALSMNPGAPAPGSSASPEDAQAGPSFAAVPSAPTENYGGGSAESNNGPSATRLPKPPASSTPPEIAIDANYDSTGEEPYQLPDPQSLTNQFAEEPNLPASDTSASASEDAANSSPDGFAMPDAGSIADSAPPAGAAAGIGNIGLINAILAADQQVAADRMKDALATLSVFYAAPDLTESERKQLLSRLDPLAGEVIYSRLHLLEQPYRVGQNETLMEIAAEFRVPWQLLANINNIEDPVVVLPGTELKVVRGPFRAEVNLAQSEMTLMLGDLYAGRFPITAGQSPAPQPGTYTIQDKQTSKAYIDPTGAAVPAGDPRNPFGDVWLDLGRQMVIHGSPATGEAAKNGCIALRAADAEDVYGILSQGSTISIRR